MVFERAELKLPLLPPSPGPLLWFGSHNDQISPASLTNKGYRVIRIDLTPDSHRYDTIPIENIPIPWIFVGLNALGLFPLNLLSENKKIVSPDGILVIEINNGISGLSELNCEREKYLLSLARLAGWLPVGVYSKSNDLARYLVLKPDARCHVYDYHIVSQFIERGFSEVFERSFGHSMSHVLWKWKYSNGKGISAVSKINHNLVAHYGGVGRSILFRGRLIKGVQICDVMVDIVARKSLSKNSAFLLTAKAFLLSLLGYSGQFQIAYGFPSFRAFEIGRKMGIYSQVEFLVEFSWERLDSRPSFTTKIQHISQIENYEDEVAELWRHMAEDMSDAIVGVRNLEYLRHRYQEHPEYDYYIYIIRNRFAKKSICLFVLRPDNNNLKFMDYLGPVKYISTSIYYARKLTASLGFSRLVAWITSRNAHLFKCWGGQEKYTEIIIPTDTLVNIIPVPEIRDRWWLMMGDTDFL